MKIRIKLRVKFRAFGVTFGTVDVPLVVQVDLLRQQARVDRDDSGQAHDDWRYVDIGRGVEVWWRIG